MKISPLLSIETIIHHGWDELLITSAFGRGTSFQQFCIEYEHLVVWLIQHDIYAVSQKIYAHRELFLTIDTFTTGLSEKYKQGKTNNFRGLLLEGLPIDAEEIAGFEIIAIKIKPENHCGLVVKNEPSYRLCTIHCNGYDIGYLNHFKNTPPLDTANPPQQQMHASLSHILTCLDKAGYKNDEILRTWFYLNEIENEYDIFNAARRDIFKKKGINRSQLPASTGIGLSNDHRDIFTSALFCFKRSKETPVKYLINPIQKEAADYGAWFSRGVSIDWGSHKTIYISGTASIGESGVSLYKNDSQQQIIRTLTNIETLLNTENATLQDIKQSTLYFSQPQDYSLYEEIVQQQELRIPQVAMKAKLCREELRFEMEAIAHITNP